MAKLIASPAAAGHRPPFMRRHQVHAARVLLGLTQDRLAELVGIAVTTIAKIEAETGNPRLSSLDALEDFFRSRGIRFTDEPGIIGTRPISPTDVP